MSIYTTPLQFGYFLALLFALLFWIRSWQEERHSDLLLGFVMFFLAMEIQNYTFGFSGINFLWEKMNGFPRSFSLAFAPTIYFYLKAQVNNNFKVSKKDLKNYIPYFIYFLFHLVLFSLGKKTVDSFFATKIYHWLNWFQTIFVWGMYIYYFYKSLQIYKAYRLWVVTQYSDTETINFIWIRNFIYLIVFGELFKFCWNIADIALGDLPFEQDWWWHLLTVCIICYVGIMGYTQPQKTRVSFETKAENTDKILQNTNVESKSNLKENELVAWKKAIDKAMEQDKLYLDAELSLSDMAQKLKTNTSILSAAINFNYNKNFNDYVNEYRVNEFAKNIKLDENKHYTLLAIAFDCGFNSKATFNRAVKKFTGKSPKDL